MFQQFPTYLDKRINDDMNVREAINLGDLGQDGQKIFGVLPFFFCLSATRLRQPLAL